MTGSRGPVSKPDGRRQRRNKRTPHVVGKGMRKPLAPADLRTETMKQWTAFWKSELATTMREEHLPMIERLFIRYDERNRAVGIIRKDGRLAKGSQGQVVLHPLLKLIDSCESAILQLEDRLGISPRSRVNAGAAGHAQGSLDELNRRLNADEEDTSHANEDPRAIVGTIGH